MENRLTVLIPCKDEERNIRACVESVRELADEILVADSGSTDGTLQLVRELGGCRIIEREFIGYSSFKNWAIPQAEHPWVLIVDADEQVTDELAAEIRKVLSGSPTLDAYSMRRRNYFLGCPIKHSGWGSSSITRLLRRDVCRYNDRSVHESIDVPSEKVGSLGGKLLHYTCQDLGEYIARLNRYTTLSAQDMHAAGRRAGYFDLLLRPPLRFLELYVWRAGFLDGIAGGAVCMTSAFYTFMKYAKLWELNKKTD